MDTTSTALTWLDAVRRVRSASYQHFVQQVPQARPPRNERTLSQAIESGLRDGGAKPAQPFNGVLTPVDAPTTTQRVDRLV